MTVRRRSGRGALFILAILLAASGALRIGTEVGAALAQQDDGPVKTEGAVPAACPSPPAALAEVLKLREERVAAREAAVKDRQTALALADETITARMTELQALEDQLRATLALADGAAEADIARLTAVYQAMKPKDAAALFEAMEPAFAAGFLGRMPPESAAAILSGMAAESAYGISVIVAGRNAGAPTE